MSKFYDKDGIAKWDSISIGKLTIHLCTPWEIKGLSRKWNPGWRLNISWNLKGDNPNQGWFFGVALTPGSRYAQVEGPSRWMQHR